jgi:hypothetical protein
MKNGDYYARLFKLHHCVGSRKFAEQVAKIQADVIEALKQKELDKSKNEK